MTMPAGEEAILDTQVVLDWLVFRDPATAALAAALEGGRLRWLASAAMRAELEHVLDRGVAAAWRPDRGTVAATFERLARPAEPLPVPEIWLRCTDPDDQKFIDLAAATRAVALISKDRAVLKLRRHCAPWFRVMTPAEVAGWLDTALP